MQQNEIQQLKQKATESYKAKDYTGALSLYRELFSKHRNECNEWDKRCYAWCIYRLEMKKRNDKISSNEESFLKAANAILNLAPQSDLVHTITALRVLDYLKSKKPFPAKEILTWTDKLDPFCLSIDCFSYRDEEGKMREVSSHKEKYYALRTKALEETKQYEECLKLSNEALSCLNKFHFDNDVWFKRRVALCKGYLGQKDQAIEELKQILFRKKDWFIQHEIATFYLDLKRLDDALKYAVDAALGYGRLEYKCELFFLLGKILQAQAKLEEAKKHILLSYQLRRENNWKIPQELQLKIGELQVDANNALASKQAYQELKEYWQFIKRSNSPKLRGKIKNILQNNVAGFICGENNKDYYFNIKDFNGKEGEIKRGLLVEFLVEKSYDKKKERESERAVNINPLS